MDTRIKNTITETRVLEILTQARHQELCRQVEEGMECLKEVWADHKVKPSIEGYSAPVQGEILLRCGTFLSYWGHFRQIKGLNEPARDWMSEAIDIFTQLNYQEKIAETEMEMGLTYWRSGEYKEAQIFFEAAAAKEISPLSSVSIKLNASRLLLYLKLPDYGKGYQLIQEKDMNVELSNDSRVKVHYYINSATLMFLIEKHGDAIKRFQKAIKYCKEVDNKIYQLVAENNIAINFIALEKYGEALEHLERAMDIAVALNDYGDQAACLDTKAQIYLAMGEPATALELAEESIKIFDKGSDNFGSLLDSLKTQIAAQIALNMSDEALMNFAEVYHAVKLNIGTAAAEGYARDFSKMLYVKRNLSFQEEVNNFEKNLLERAFEKCGGLITPAADFLKISHQVLSRMLQTRHRDLVGKLGIKIRSRRGTAEIIKKTPAESKITSKPVKPDSEPGTEIIRFGDLRIKKPAELKFNRIVQISTDRLSHLGLSRGILAVVARATSLSGAFPSVIREKTLRQLHTGFLTEFGGMVGLETDVAEPIAFLPEDIENLGSIIGYLRPEGEIYVFEYLNHPVD